ncbi:MAG: hypothetical protein WEB50_08680 [Vicinamibacterales bacterium]
MRILPAAVLLGACVAGLSWQNPAAQTQQPRFRARTDLLTIDVTVLDRNRRPVTGLTADDFILLEDGRPQVIAALDEISVEGPEQVGAEWLKAPPQDVAANRHDESRLFVLVIDDATLPADPYFAKRPLTVTGLMLEATPAWRRTSDDRVRAVIPVLPTTRRQFATSDAVTLFFRIHQRPGRAPKEVTRTLRITNGRDEVVSTLSETIPPAAFGTSGAEQRVVVPISALGTGQYLLSVELTARGEQALERQLSFTVH